MSKSRNFFGQPIYGQLIKSLNRDKIVETSRKHGGEKYVKSFDGYTHLLTMLYAVIQRFDSLREIETSMTAEVRKLHHVSIDNVPKRSTLSDANARRSEKFFEKVYRDLYASNRDILSSDSRRWWYGRVDQVASFDRATTQPSLLLRTTTGLSFKSGRKTSSMIRNSYRSQ